MPRICADLVDIRLHGFDYTTNAELVVVLAAIQRANDEIDDAQMKVLALIRLLVCDSLLLLLDLKRLEVLMIIGEDKCRPFA